MYFLKKKIYYNKINFQKTEIKYFVRIGKRM